MIFEEKSYQFLELMFIAEKFDNFAEKFNVFCRKT